MRNGLNGVGIVNGAGDLPSEVAESLVNLDATLDLGESRKRVTPITVVMDPQGSSWRTDVVEFITSTDDATGAAMVGESTAGRVVFIGSPGPLTGKALERVRGGGRWANVVAVPLPGEASRIMWRQLDDHVLVSGPECDGVPLEDYTRPTKRRTRKPKGSKSPKPSTAPQDPPVAGGE